jgi:DNA-binding transcriptional ArsR family regulator
MPIADPPSAPPPRPPLRVTVTPSAAVELFWVLALDPGGSPRVAHPAVRELYAAHGDLAERLLGIWEPGRDRFEAGVEHALPELLLLADRAGALEGDDFAGLPAALEAAAPAPGAPALVSETDADRAVILGRLSRLAEDPVQRRRWVELIASVAADVGAVWHETAAGAVGRACRARASQLPWADEQATIERWARQEYGGLLPGLLRGAAATGGEIVVVPSYWSGRGVLFDLPAGRVLLGIPAQYGPSESRARTEAWSRRLKALADPTRLAMADYLAGTERTVGELAADFGLAQPTASRHVGLLRDAGLLLEARQGPVTRVRTDPTAVLALLDELAAALAGPREGRDRSQAD